MSNENIQKRTTRVFALLIGINHYQDKDIASLKGCVNDVDSMESFLRYRFKDPTIKRLINDIGPEDVMVFYYAGRGSRVKAPNGWKTAEVETICPYDQNTIPEGKSTLVCGIPDRTLSVRLREVSSKRQNNNIIVILDCCHSGGMGRNENSGHKGQVRSIHTSNPSDEDFNQDAWIIHDGRDSELSHLGFRYPLMSSHVLLAACQPQEKAFETLLNLKTRAFDQGSMYLGVFTSHLVSKLYKATSNEQSTTYVTLVHDLLPSESWGNKQHPACEGTNNKRHLFSMTSEKPMFKLTKDESSGGTSYKADAGWIHGAVEGTKFIVQPNRGTLVADKVGSDSCHLVFKRDRFHIPRDGRALMSVGKTLKVYLGAHVGGSNVRNRFTIVTERSEAHIAVQFSNGRTGVLSFEVVDHGRLLQHAKPSGQVLSKDLASLLYKIAYFNFHLYRASADLLPDKHGYPKDSKSPDKRGRQLLDECGRPLHDKRGSPLLDERVRMRYNEDHRPLHNRIKLKLVPLAEMLSFRVPIEGKERILDENKPTSVNIPTSSMHYGLTLENGSHWTVPYQYVTRILAA
ncbi:caspase domain-containing protein [Gautieria morchelliformis]|nr:caspase domain-containing protein [Gautieria morchelliformis]